MTTEPLWRTDEQPKTRQGPRRLLRELLNDGKLHAVPGVYDGLSARICEQSGIQCVLTGGSTISNTLLGLPDAEFLTLDQVAAVVGRITSVVSIPVYVDADTGFGNAINVAHTVHMLEKAGASAVRIEDQVAPKRSGHIAGKTVVSIEEMVGKIKAAVDARVDPDLVIVARCDARASEGVEGAIERCNAYAEAGAEVTVVDGALTREEMQRFVTDIKVPYHQVGLGGSAKTRTTPKLPLDELEAMGYNLASFGLHVVRAAALSMREFAFDLAERGIQADIALLERLEGLPIEDWYSFTGFDGIRTLEERYLPREALSKYESGPAPYYQPDVAGKGA